MTLPLGATPRPGPTLVLTSSWPRTGDELAGTFVRTDTLVRARTGARVVVAAPVGPGRAHGGAGLEVVDVAHHGLFGSPGAAWRARQDPRRLLGIWPFFQAIRALVARVEPTTIVAHWLLPTGALARRCAPHGCRLELVAHGADVRLLEAMPRPVARAVLSATTRGAEVCAVSEALADRLVGLLPALRGGVRVAPMPLATDDARIVEDARDAGGRLRGQHRPPLHVVAARLVASKGIERAIEHVAARGGSLVLVGDGPRRAALVAHARALGVELHAVGARPHHESLAWLCAADVVLAPLAAGEGAPTVVREARALGRPVLTFES